MGIPADALGVRLDVRTPGDLAVDAISVLQDRMPQWVPRNGAVEVVLLEALAELVGGVVSAADVILGGVVESSLESLHQVPRLPGAGATGNLTVTFDSPVTTTIPAGTRFLLADAQVELESTADVSVAAASSATVPVASPESTSAINGLDSAAAVDVLDYVPNAISVAVSGVLAGGADPEGDEEYLARARYRLSRLASTLVTAESFAAYVLEDGRARNAVCIPAWDGAAIGTVGADGGHVTVATYGRGGQVAAVDRLELVDAMQAITAAGVTVHVDESDVTDVDVTTTVAAVAGWNADDVRVSVTLALEAHLNPETWEWGETVRVTTLIAVVAGADGVDYVDSLTVPAGDVTLPVNGLAAAGALTISVV